MSWNSKRVRPRKGLEYGEPGVRRDRRSRVVVLHGPSTVVNLVAIRLYLADKSGKIRFKLDDIVIAHDGDGSGETTIEVRFSRYAGQAAETFYLLWRRVRGRGHVTVKWGIDPCTC